MALKSLNSRVVNQMDKVKFLQEAVLMAQFKHPNVIQLYGVVSIGQPVSCNQDPVHLRKYNYTLF